MSRRVNMGRPRTAADSVPPDTEQDPQWADRHGEQRHHVLPADAENPGHLRRHDGQTAGRTGGDGGWWAAPPRQWRPVLPGREQAVAGPLGRIRLPAVGRRGADGAVDGTDPCIGRSGVVVTDLTDRARSVAGTARRRWRDRHGDGHTGHQRPHGLSADASHRGVSPASRAFYAPRVHPARGRPGSGGM